MNAVILAGGFGSRLSPLTIDTPKPMLTIANRPCLDYSVTHLQDLGINNFVFSLGFLPHKVIEWAVHYPKSTIRFSVENTPLGTAGGIKAVEKFLDNVFIVSSGDAISAVDFSRMLAFHMTTGALCTLAAVEVLDASRFGVVRINGRGIVERFIEKPKEAGSGLVNTGIYIISKKLLSIFPSNEKLDFALDVFPHLVKTGQLAAFIHEGYWCDIGSQENFYKSNFDLLGTTIFNKSRNYKSGKYNSVFSMDNLVANSASVHMDIQNCIIGAGAVVTKNASLKNCIVLENAIVRDSHQNAIIGTDFVENIIPAQSFALNSTSSEAQTIAPNR